MSASEKLRALDMRFRASDPPSAATDDRWTLAALELQDALPQIRALAKEVERQIAESHPDDVDLELAAALAALDKALP